MTSFYTHARNFPPVLVRLLARRKGGPPLTTAEIVERSQGSLDAYQVMSISASTSWDEIPFGRMKAFIVACQVDFTSRSQMNRTFVYLKLPHKFRYLQSSPEWENILKTLVALYRAHIASKINQVR
jgi:hypothetical protein